MERKIILAVDDNLKNLQVLGQILRAQDYSIIMAQSGENTLKILKENTPDLILLDIMMPEMDGYEVCRKIKEIEHLKNIPVIFVTAKIETENLVQGFNVGGVDYITKPFNKDELLIRIKNHIELADARKILKEQADQILEMNKGREKIYSIIAHDIRSPLSLLTMLLNNLLGKSIEFGSDDYYEIINHLSSTTKDTLQLLDNLLLWTRGQAGKLVPVPKDIKASEYISESIGFINAKAQNKSIEIVTEINEQSTIHVDPNMFSTILRNLLSNAVKFTPKGGKIFVKINQTKQQTNIIIQDTGIGFMPDELEKFKNNISFTKFGTDNETGSGLGLTLVKEFTIKNNGSLEVESKPHEGTQFKLTFKK